MNHETTPGNKADDLAILLGKQDVVVTLRDGTKETVSVSVLSIRKIQDYMLLQDSLADTIELVCAKEKGWADTLTLESAFELDEIARKLNDPFLEKFIQRQMNAIAKMKPMHQKVTDQVSSI